ncbi:hypothetical protein MIND_00930600 [Mycena indigotica]|uniref:DUF6534 domain-containing protein n=1 Tax=Mycena indigotica TaxID=2126181 RepID=A0A8H6VWU3_9AGAR|nr:uncharacterized protein MIND_00930600 [Mycena indigotica]KAF7296984.1 hypothetical protein MIND_00930600 [Mycena indigotica]
MSAAALAFDPDSTYGALLVGAILSAILFGVSTVQIYIYHSRFLDDNRVIKALVSIVWLCEVLHLTFVSHTLYTWIVTDWGHPELLLAKAPFSLGAAIIITTTVSCLVQGFFSWRIQRSKVQQSSAFVDQIIKWTVETGVTTSLFTTVILICFHQMPHNLIWLGLWVMEARLFANSLFASLNSRTALREMRNNFESHSGGRSSSGNEMQRRRGPFAAAPPITGISVEMHSHIDMGDPDRDVEMAKASAW